MIPVARRTFGHVLTLVCTDAAWTRQRIAATTPLRAAGSYRGFVRLDTAAGPRFAYFAARSSWIDQGEPIAEGLLYEVAPTLRLEPRRFPSNGRRFREIGEATITDDDRVFDSLRRAYD